MPRVLDRPAALKFLCKRFERKNTIRCTACNSKKYYVVSRGNLRCASCKTDYRPFDGTYLETVHIDFVKWLILIKLFTLGTSARQALTEAYVSYPTTLRIFESLRKSIVYHMSKTDKQLRGEIEADEAYFGGKRKGNRGRGAKNKTIVFGVLERNRRVHVDIVKNVKAITLLVGIINKVRKGSVVYTDQWKGYSTLIFHGYKHHSIHNKMFGRGKVYINGIEGFWSFAKERMMKYHGIRSDKFLLYLKEIQSQGSRPVFIIGRLCAGGK